MIRMGLLLLVIGVALAFFAHTVHWLLYWLALEFVILAGAYFTSSHNLMGKRADGTLPWWSWLLFAPYLAINYGVWHFVRVVSREPKFVEITDHLTVGRRLLPGEASRDFDNYVDLTSEFSEPRALREMHSYRCVPMLDAGYLSPARMCESVGSLRRGRTYVHCAQGHGRTGLFAALVLLSAGAVKSVDEALLLLQSKRPAIRLKSGQRACAEACAAMLQRTSQT